MEKNPDFALEKRLRSLDKKLHKKFTSLVFSMQYILKRYQMVFPTFTDHTMVHSLNVIEFCNRIIGEQINNMNADEIYVLLLSCYLHDTGMGISMKEYVEFSKNIDFKDFFASHDKKDIPLIIRSFHHEFSGQFIKKYASFLEIPSDEHVFAIVQTCRGHRKVDLEDINEYPVEYALENGNAICLPYLSALLRLADEIDVTSARNCLIDYDLNTLNDIDLLEFSKHEAVRDLKVTDKEFIVLAKTDDEELLKALHKMVEKMQSTLDLCRHAVNIRTKFSITQEKVILQTI